MQNSFGVLYSKEPTFIRVSIALTFSSSPSSCLLIIAESNVFVFFLNPKCCLGRITSAVFPLYRGKSIRLPCDLPPPERLRRGGAFPPAPFPLQLLSLALSLSLTHLQEVLQILAYHLPRPHFRTSLACDSSILSKSFKCPIAKKKKKN